MTKLYSLIVFTCILINCEAQHQTDKWYFGFNAGVDFTSGTPVVLNDGALNNLEGAASMSDVTGNLLFYTDGQTIWNRLHHPMSNGTGLLGGIASQTTVIVPLPGSSTQYYVFTNDVVNGPNGLNYSIVDMSLDSGRGDVSILNGFIQDGLTERITSTINASGNAYWITVHEFGTDSFYNYRLNGNGLDSIFVISATGLINSTSLPQNAYGQMKYSPCGNKLAVATGYLDTVQVFDFDNATGIISNPITIPMTDHVFGIEFSPDGQKIYVSTYGLSTLFQFDLSSGIQANIIASATALSITSDTYGLQLASDGKIYVSKNQSPVLGAITDPDVPGPSCHYVDAFLNIDPLALGHTVGLCLPGFVQSYFQTAACNSNGTNEIESSNENIFPNPTNDQFTLLLNSNSNVSVYDSGMRLINSYESVKTFSFGKEFPKGFYFIIINAGNELMSLKGIKY